VTTSNEITYDLSEIISPAFYNPHLDLREGKVNQLVLKGGRGSAKSSYASIEGILLILEHPEIHGVAMRKVSNTLRTTVYAQYIWALTALGLHGKFKCTVAPMEIVYKKTGQKIMFFGADDPGKIKSLKVSFGYVGYLHLEELDQFAGESEVRNIEQSVMRGGELAFEIKSFNPPRTKDNWANKYCLREKPGQLIHHSTYETTPKEWLGQRFIDDADYLKETNPDAHEHEYGGIANGTGGSIFENVIQRKITDDEIKTFDRPLYGVDWGYYPDPFHFGEMYFHSGMRKLYIYGELRLWKTNNQKVAERLDKYKRVKITADSAEPKSIGDFREWDFNMHGAVKGPGSVEYGIKWLQGLTQIIIDPGRCPYTAKEFIDYEYERNKDDEIISGYPDEDNHAIDMTRYATEDIWRIRGK